MAVTEDRLTPERVTRERPTPQRAETTMRAWRRRISLAWLVSMGALIAFEPVPSNPDAAEPAWATVLGVAFLATLGAMAVGLGRMRRSAFVLSGVAGALGMFLAYACLASGHHLGAWWMIELGVLAGLTVASITAFDRTKR